MLSYMRGKGQPAKTFQDAWYQQSDHEASNALGTSTMGLLAVLV